MTEFTQMDRKVTGIGPASRSGQRKMADHQDLHIVFPRFLFNIQYRFFSFFDITKKSASTLFYLSSLK